MESNSKPLANEVEEYVLFKSVKKMISCPFSITYFNHINFLSAKQEYTWLKYYVDNSLEPSKSELSSLLYPVFCYLYITLLKKGENEGAAVFFENYSILFSAEKNMEFLSGLRSIEDFENIMAFCKFFEKNVKCLAESESIENMSTTDFFNIFEKATSENVSTTCLNFTEDENFIPKFYEFCNKYKNLESIDRDIINEFLALWDRCKSRECLSSINSIKDIMAALDFSHFLTHKYIIKMSPNVLEDLTSKLESINSKALVYIMHFHFYFDDLDLEDQTIEKSGSQVQNSTNPKANLDKGLSEISSSEMVKKDAEMEVQEESVSKTSLKYIQLQISDVNKESKLNYHPGDIDVFKKQLTISIKCDIFVLNNYSSHEDSISALKSNEINPTVPPEKSSGVHSAEILAVKYIPAPQASDSSFLLTGSSDKTVKILDTKDFKSFGVFTGHKGPVKDIDCSTSLKGYFATASEDYTAALWTLGTGSRILKSYIGHVDSVNCVRFHPNGLYLGTGSSDRSVRFWDLEHALCLKCFLSESEEEITTISFCFDGNCIASGDKSGKISLYDIRSGNNAVFKKGQKKHVPESVHISMLEDHKIMVYYNESKFRCMDIRCSNDAVYETNIIEEFTLPESSIQGFSYFQSYFVFY